MEAGVEGGLDAAIDNVLGGLDFGKPVAVAGMGHNCWDYFVSAGYDPGMRKS